MDSGSGAAASSVDWALNEVIYEGPRTKRLRQKYGHERLVTADALPREPPQLTPQKPSGGAAATSRLGGCKELEIALQELERAAPASPAPPVQLQSASAAWFRQTWDAQRVVGHTSSTEVFLALHRPTGQQHAIKKVNKRMFERTQRRKNSHITLGNEVRILESLRHPRIVQMHESFETKEHMFIVMEYLPCDLYRSIDTGGHFPESMARRLFREVCEAIGYMHQRNIVHRDIKPENVLLTSADRSNMHAKLADFGISRTLTRVCETYCGTRSYAAPEVVKQKHHRLLARLQGGALGDTGTVEAPDKENCLAFGSLEACPGYGRPADLWSLGVLLYIVLSGFPPFDPDSEVDVLHSEIIKGSWQFDVPEWKLVSLLAKELVSRLMTVDPSARPPIEEAMRHAWFDVEASA